MSASIWNPTTEILSTDKRQIHIFTYLTADEQADYIARTAGKDLTASLQAALDYAESVSGKLIASEGTALISDTLHIRCDCDFSQMEILVDASVVNKAIQVGNADSTYIAYLDIKLPKLINTKKLTSGAGWAGFDTSTGVEIGTLYESRIYNKQIYGFGFGMSLGGYSSGCVYNDIFVGTLAANKVNMRIRPQNTGGWANENNFFGGRFFHSSAEGTAVSGVRHILIEQPTGSTLGAPNNNVFYRPSLEGNEQEFHVDLQGAFNLFISPRLEVGTGIPARFRYYAETAGETTGNDIIGGYDLGIIYTYAGAGTCVNNMRWGAKGNNTLDFSGNGVNVVNRTGSSYLYPHFQGFESNVAPLNSTDASTNWIYRIHGGGISVKSAVNTFPRVDIRSDGRLVFGSGGVAADVELSRTAVNTLSLGAGDILKLDGTYTAPLQLGTFYLWVEIATGKLRIKSSAPTTDNDGTVVGTQA